MWFLRFALTPRKAIITMKYAFIITLLILTGAISARAASLDVCATTPDLGALAAEVGGEYVRVTVFAKGREDPHFVEARPSFIRDLHRADLFILTGMELEIGWAPALINKARNRDVLPGGRGYLDASRAIVPFEVPTATFDRSMGDVHAQGNPHYMLDPVNGYRVAQLIRDKLCQLDPAHSDGYHANCDDFARRLAAALCGEGTDAAAKLERLARGGSVVATGGWLAQTQSIRGAKVVGDHNAWVYFTERFGLDTIGFMEPIPGQPPTMRHLRSLVERMNAQGVHGILSIVYFRPEHARFLAEHTDAGVIDLAHQVGARPGTDSYIDMIDHNVRAAAALGGGS
jgi:ABC-type Zn uptake system ZnuABC Zn-binding protein ZnuA